MSINQGIKLFTPYYWGNPYYAENIRQFRTNADKINTVFFGSSRIYRHADPRLFDSLNFNTVATRSYSLASPGCSNPETYYLLENYLKNEASNVKYVLLELQIILPVAGRNLHTSRANYWINFNEYIFVLNYYLSKKNCEDKYWEAIKNATYSFLENSLNLGMIQDLLVINPYYSRFIGKNRDGYFPIEDELLPAHKTRRKNLMQDTSVIQRKLGRYKKVFSSDQRNPCTEIEHLKRINLLIEKAKQKNIHLIFVIPPLLTKHENIKELYDHIPDSNKINLADGVNFPELYLIENIWDDAHLNNKGAEAFTSALSHEFIELIKRNPNMLLTSTLGN